MQKQTVGENSDARAMAGGSQQSYVDSVALPSLHWFVVAALGCRVALTIPAAILNRSVLGAWGDRLLPLVIGVLVLDGLLIIGALRRPAVIGSWWLFAADMTVTMLVTVAATLLIAPGTFLVAGRDAMTGYGWGTVALWTALRGWRTGAALLCATPLVQIAMATLNDAPLDADGTANLVARTAIAAVNFAVTVVIVTLADRGARTAAAAGLEAGRLAARADALRRHHDTALAELDAMVLQAAQQSRPVDRRLAAITGRAGHLASEWRAAPAPVPADDLMTALADLRAELAGRGLRVALVGGIRLGVLRGRADVVTAVVGAVREALNNVAKHTEVQEAVVAVTADAEQVTVDVRDEGPGFAAGARVRPYLPQQEPVLDAVLGTLFVAHVFALAALARRRQSRLLRSPLVLAVDLAVATCLVLWFATAEASGQVVLPGADGAWLYILGTVPFWIAVRGGRVGAAGRRDRPGGRGGVRQRGVGHRRARQPTARGPARRGTDSGGGGLHAARCAASPDNRLAATLTALAAEMRQVGLRVEVVVTELDGDPPPLVLDAAVSAVRATLVDLAENEPGAAPVIRVSGSAEGLDVRLRGGSGCHACPASIAAMAAVGGRVLTHAAPSGAARTSLQWSAA